MLVDGPIITAVFKVEASVGRLAIGGDDDSRLLTFGVGEDGEGQANRQGHVLNSDIDWTSDNHVVGNDLGFVESELKMGMILKVASGEAARLDVDGVVLHPFDLLAMDVTATLFGPHFVDDAFFCLEVIKPRIWSHLG